MTSPANAQFRELLRWVSRWLVRVAKEAPKRGYALALIVLIVWVSYRSVAYLIVALIVPSGVPPQITGLPIRMDEQLLHGRRPDWLGLQTVDNPRAPLSHYHRFDSWLQSDDFNDCTRSGCHGPLPHSKRKEDRAFLNMHATSMHCGVCHMKDESRPLSLTWYDMSNGKAQDVPALVEVYEWLAVQSKPEKASAMSDADQKRTVRLLRKAAAQANGEASLVRLADHIAAVRPGGRAFVDFLLMARELVERSFRGSYGAKLALRRGEGREPILGHEGVEPAVKEWLDEGSQATGERRKNLLDRVHPARRQTPLTCTDCHRREDSLIDFAAVGFPPPRIKALTDPAVFSMIENISHGTPFHLPDFMGVRRPPSTTQPAD